MKTERVTTKWRCLCGKMGNRKTGQREITLPEGTVTIDTEWVECECGNQWFNPGMMDRATINALSEIIKQMRLKALAASTVLTTINQEWRDFKRYDDEGVNDVVTVLNSIVKGQ